jgi:hypothetical protein
MDLLGAREQNEAYLAATPGEAYLIYFTDGGSVRLELEPNRYQLHWINVNSGEAAEVLEVPSAESVVITAPSHGSWLAALIKE